MATDPFVNSQESDLRKKWALMQLQMAGEATPVRHPMQAVARALQGAMGGYMAGEAKREDDATGAATFSNLPGLRQAPAADPAMPASPAPMPAPTSPRAPSAPMVNNKVYSNNEPSPLDPPSGNDRDLAIRTILAEAGNQSPIGQQAVGNVIRNRAVAGNFGGDTPAGVVQSPNQFEPWNTTGGRTRMAGYDPSSPQYQQAAAALDRAYTGDDPTKGATQFFAPKAQAALGRPVPAWGQSGGQDIGDHRFFGGAQGGESPGIDVASAQSRMPGQQPDAVPQNGPAPRSNVQIPPDVAETIKKLGANSATRAQAWQLYMQYAKPVDRVEAMTPAQRKQWGVPDGMSAGIETVTGKPVFSPPQTNVNLNTAQKGQEVMATESAQDFKNAQAAGREATKRAQVWDTMEKASQGFKPGATASTTLEAKRYLRDLGVIKGDDVPDAEVFKQMQQQLAIHAQPKGQGSVSNFERDMYAKSIANMDMSPEALSRAIQTGRKLDEFDRKVAQIYRDNARKNGGVPDSITINEEIDKLGSPLSPAEMNYLRRTGDGKQQAPGAQPPAYDRSAIEKEMKLRGIPVP